MDIAQYRHEFRDFHQELEQDNLRRRDESRRAAIDERYSDLWSPDAVAELRRKLDETTAHFQTERAATTALMAFASRAFVRWRAREVSAELERCEVLAAVEWDGVSLPARQARVVIAGESNEQRRRELDARRIDALDVCADLRASRLETEQESAALLGAGSWQELAASLAGTNLTQLSGDAQEFLRRSAPAYDALRRRVRPPAAARPTYADYLYDARNLPPLARLSIDRALRAFDNTLAAGGLLAGRQKNVTVRCGDSSAGELNSACYAVDPPEEVVLLAGALPGGLPFAMLLHEAARAQFYCWISREQTSRYPEFTYAVDRTTSDGYGCLFRLLTHDELWLAEHANLPPKEINQAAAAFAFLHAHEVRRAAAALECHLAQNADPDFCAEALTAATGYVYQPAQFLIDAESLFEATAKLRAWSFAAGLNEYLRTRHGSRWWATRRAADELIDFWNTGSRYAVEELAALIGFAPRDFEIFTAHLSAVAKGA